MTLADEEPDSRAVLTWAPAPLPRRAFTLKLNCRKDYFLAEKAKPLLVLTVAPNNEWRLGYIAASIFSRCDREQGEARFLVTCEWGHDDRYWSHAPSTKAAKRIAARWLENRQSFSEHYRIETP